VTEVAVIAFAETAGDENSTTSGVEMLVPAIADALGQAGLGRRDIGFWCSGSSDYLAGRAFSFVQAVDALGAVPPIAESHVEMDGAWALYEAWVKILTGDAQTALVYGFGKGTAGDLSRVLALQLDPYLTAPLWPDATSLAALQARLGIEAGLWSEKEMAEVAARTSTRSADELSAEPYVAEPLRAHDCAPYTDGAWSSSRQVPGRASSARGRPGSPGSRTAPIPGSSGHGISPARHRPSRPRRPRARCQETWTWRSCTRRSVIRNLCSGRRWTCRRARASARRVACSAGTGTRCSPPGWPGSGTRPAR
jgi:hypothetical protein